MKTWLRKMFSKQSHPKQAKAHLRTRLELEPLEKRTVLSGSVSIFAYPFPGFLGHLIILNDTLPFTANAISINQVTILGKPNIEVKGFNSTGVNGVTNGVGGLPLAGPTRDTALVINDPNFFGDP